MNNTSIKKMVEEKIKINENKYANRIELTFASTKPNNNEIITLEGDGCLKVLMSVK